MRHSCSQPLFAASICEILFVSEYAEKKKFRYGESNPDPVRERHIY